MKVDYAVTFEFDTRPPLTHRGVVTAGSLAAVAGKAIRAAKRACRPVNPCSMNFVALSIEKTARAQPSEPIVEAVSAHTP